LFVFAIISGFNEAVSGQGGVSDHHRQTLGDLVHLSRNTGPEIAGLAPDFSHAHAAPL